MPLAIDLVLIDCVALDAMTAFWRQALDLEHVWTGPSGGHLLAAVDGSGCRLALMPTHDEKTSKNRVHFDLRPDGDQQDEARRLEGLGRVALARRQGARPVAARRSMTPADRTRPRTRR